MAYASIDSIVEDSVLYILSAKIQKKRLSCMTNIVEKFGFTITSIFSPIVTHVLSELETRDDVIKKLQDVIDEDDVFCEDIEIISTSWITQSAKQKKRLNFEEFKLPAAAVKNEVPNQDQELSVPKYACQRATPLQHHNHKFTEALDILAEESEYRNGGMEDYAKALAFRNASSVLKSLPSPVRWVAEAQKLPHIGGHTRGVIKDILELGYSCEVDKVLKDPWFQKMRTFTSIFGVGSSTAQHLIDQGLDSVQQVSSNLDAFRRADHRVAVGLAFYEDLSLPVMLHEAQSVQAFICDKAEQVLSGVRVDLMGGFRRGKNSGHDVDLLISHPKEGYEEGFLLKLLRRLAATGVIVYGNYEKSTFTPDAYRAGSKAVYLQSTLDHFEKWIGVIKVNRNLLKIAGAQNHTPSDKVKSTRKRSLDVSSYESTPGSVESNLTHEASDQKKQRTSLESQSEISPLMAPDNNVQSVGNANMNSIDVTGSRDTMLPPSVRLKQQSSISGSLDHCDITSFINRRRSFDEFQLEASEDRDWIARRVDLIVVPASQYPYAVVGWTGSKLFNRAARNYAKNERNASLTSHGLYDHRTKQIIPAGSEKEVFDLLKLPYLPPEERNC